MSDYEGVYQTFRQAHSQVIVDLNTKIQAARDAGVPSGVIINAMIEADMGAWARLVLEASHE